MKTALSLIAAGLLAAAAACSAAPAHKHAPAAALPPVVAVSFDAAGRLWRAQARNGQVLVSWSDDRGRSFGAPLAVNRKPEKMWLNGENRPKVVSDGKGNVYVTWTQMLDVPFAGAIRYARSSDGGRSFSDPVTINDDPRPISHRFDSVAVNDRGQVWVTWLDKRHEADAKKQGQPYAGAAIYYARSDDGVKFGPNRKLADHSCECCRIGLRVDGAGVPVAAWRHVFGKSTRDHALARLDSEAPLARVTNDGWDIDACPHSGPALSIGADGSYHFTWFTGAEGRTGLGYAQSRDGGKTWGAPLRFGDADRQASHADVHAEGASVYLVWKEFDGEEASVLARRSRDGGRSWSGASKVASTRGDSDYPFVVGHRGEAFLSWATVREGHRIIPLGKD